MPAAGPARSDRHAFHRSRFPPLEKVRSEIAVEARRKAASLGLDVAGEGRAEMAGHQSRARARAMFQRYLPAFACVVLIETGEAVPLRMIDLHRMVQDVAAEQRLLALRFELDRDGAGRVAGRRLYFQALVEGSRSRHHLRKA